MFIQYSNFKFKKIASIQCIHEGKVRSAYEIVAFNSHEVRFDKKLNIILEHIFQFRQTFHHFRHSHRSPREHRRYFYAQIWRTRAERDRTRIDTRK